MFDNPSIYDEFEYPGVWWHPTEESTQTTGFLKSSFDETNLTLYGKRKLIHSLEQAAEKDGDAKATIWGGLPTIKTFRSSTS